MKRRTILKTDEDAKRKNLAVQVRQPSELERQLQEKTKSSSNHCLNYLGLPIGSNMKSIASWRTLVDRFHMRLSSWKANLLSIGGRLTLINSVLGSL
ncbi:hypothetical protein Tco_0436837, partial [Tanacetum coccineum]